jgi:hypothetical protein
MGAIAGRLKRLWLADPDGHGSGGQSALEWYQKGFSLSRAANNHEQAYYHGINIAFLQLALLHQPADCKATAALVLDECGKAPGSMWRSATMGEAALYTADPTLAMKHYQNALDAGPDAREAGSMYQQAIWAARLLKDAAAEGQLQELFANRA